MRQKIEIRILIFMLLFVTWWEAQCFIIQSTSSLITNPIPTFPAFQIEMLKSENEGLVDDALEETKKRLLKHIAPRLSEEPWKVDYIFANLTSGQEPEVVFSLSLTPDQGILAVLQKQNSEYFLISFLDKLLPIYKLDKLPLTDQQEILITCEEHQEHLGAFCEVKNVTAWGWQNNSFQSVWSEKTFWEINWLKSWQDPTITTDKWFKLMQNYKITFVADTDSPTIKAAGLQVLYEAPAGKTILPSPEKFTKLCSRELEQAYTWDKDFGKFVLGRGIINKEGCFQEKAAIIKDLSIHLETLGGEENNTYEVITKKGEHLTITKDQISLK